MDTFTTLVLMFFLATSFSYVVVWNLIIQPSLRKAVKNFDPSKGTRKGTSVIYPPNSREGQILMVLIYGAVFNVGAITTLGGTILFSIIWAL